MTQWPCILITCARLIFWYLGFIVCYWFLPFSFLCCQSMVFFLILLIIIQQLLSISQLLWKYHHLVTYHQLFPGRSWTPRVRKDLCCFRWFPTSSPFESLRRGVCSLREVDGFEAWAERDPARVHWRYPLQSPPWSGIRRWRSVNVLNVRGSELSFFVPNRKCRGT